MKKLWLCALLMSLSSTTFAYDIQVEKPTGPDIILKDSEGKDLKITEETKIDVEILDDVSLANAVLDSQIRVKLKAGTQTVQYLTSFSLQNQNPMLVGLQKDNNQSFDLQCRLKLNDYAADALKTAKYTKSKVDCLLENADCQSYLLKNDKSFSLEKQKLCIGKKEVEISEQPIEVKEVVRCALIGSIENDKIKHGVVFNLTRKKGALKHTKEIANSSCQLAN